MADKGTAVTEAADKGGAVTEAADVTWDSLGRACPLSYAFGFALDQENFSDYQLRLEILPDAEFAGKFSLSHTRHRFYLQALRSEGVPSGNLAGLGPQEEIRMPITDLPQYLEVRMPLLSPAMTKGSIVKWVKKEGDKLLAGDTICEVQGSIAKSVEIEGDNFSPDETTAEVETESSIKWVKKEGDTVSPTIAEVEMGVGAVSMEGGYVANIIRADCSNEIKVGEIICLTVSGECYLALIVRDDGSEDIIHGETICVIVKEESHVQKLKDYRSLSPHMDIPSSGVQEFSTEAHVEGIIKSGAPKINSVPEVKLVWINSVLMAAHSNYFHKLFTNGLKESKEKLFTYTIRASEEDVTMKIVNFCYTGELTTTDPCLLLDISTVADSLEVDPLVEHVIRLLINLPMSTASALLYIDYPYTPKVQQKVSYLIESAKTFVINKYQYLNSIPDELWHLPLVGIELVFANSEIHVDSEDAVYDFLSKWVSKQYPDPVERLAQWIKVLLPLLRFSSMSLIKLKEIAAAKSDVLHCPEMLQCITDALIGATVSSADEVQRYYTYKPVVLAELYKQTIIHMDLSKDECSRLAPDGHVCSQKFSFYGQKLFLVATCDRPEGSYLDRFGFWVGKDLHDGGELTVNMEFASRSRAGRGYVTRLRSCGVTLDGDRNRVQGGRDLFDSWHLFISDDDNFIDGVLRMRVELTLVE